MAQQQNVKAFHRLSNKARMLTDKINKRSSLLAAGIVILRHERRYRPSVRLWI